LAAIAFAFVFVGGAIGLELQHRLPEGFTTGGPRDMTSAVVGLMTLLLALVLGLLIWTAYGVFSTQKASVQTLAVTDLKLDEAFQDYGPEAAEAIESSEMGSRTRSPKFGNTATTSRLCSISLAMRGPI
jgi:hypothetical protein